MMKRLFFILFAMFFAVSAEAAPAQDASIEKLLTLTHSKKLNAEAIADSDDIIETTLKPLLHGKGMTEEKKKIIDDFLNQYKAIVKDELSWEKTLPEYLRIYRETFTEEEIQSLIAFYESPTGQMFIRKTPQIIEKMSDFMREKLVSIMSRLNTALTETLKANASDRTAVSEKP